MALVETLRRMLAVAPDQYTVGATAYWTDEQLQAVIDEHVSCRLVQIPVEMGPSIASGGGIVYLHGQIPRFAGTLDTATVELTDIHGEAIDPETWTVAPDGCLDFTVDQRGYLPEATALAYDLNAAAAEVCDAWATALSSAYDVSMDGQSLKRSQMAASIAARADRFRAKKLPKTIRLTRRDVANRKHERASDRLMRSFDQWGN